MSRIKTIETKNIEKTVKNGGCGECQTSCQSACKTSCGVAIAVWLNEEWLSTLAQMRCSVPTWIYIAGVLAVMVFIYTVQLLLSWRVANENPVEMIKRNN